MTGLGLFRAGSAFAFLTGTLHFLGRFAPLPDDPKFAIARDAMQAFSLRIVGVETDLHAIHELLDWCFTLFCLFVGVLDWVAARALAASPPALRAAAAVNAVGFAALAATAFAFRVVPPAVFFLLSLVCFAAAIFRSADTKSR